MPSSDVLKIRLVADGATQTRNEILGVDDSFNRLDKSSNRLSRGISLVGGALAGLGVASLTRFVVDTTVEFERLEATLRQIEGGVDAGSDAFARIQKLASETPFQLQQLTDGYIKLKSFGLDPLDGTYQALIDQASALGGSQETLNGVILAVGQAWAKQKLQGEEILQLIERGVPVWQLLEQVTGENATTLQDLSSKGELGRDVIAKLIQEIGKLNSGAAAEQVDTLGGAISNLRDSSAQLAAAIGDAGLSDALSSLARGASGLATSIKDSDLPETIRAVGFGIGGLVVARTAGPFLESLGKGAVVLSRGMVGLNVSLVAATAQMELMRRASNGLNAGLALLGGPAGLAVLAGTAIAYFATQNDDAQDSTESLAEKVDRLTGSLKGLRQTELETTASEIREEMAAIAAEIQRQQELFSRGDDQAVLTGRINKLKELGTEYDAMSTQLSRVDAELQKTEQSTTNLSNANDDAADAADEHTKALENQAKVFDRLVGRLNPLQARARQYAEELALIQASNVSLSEQADLIRKLQEEFAAATGGPNEISKSASNAKVEIEAIAESATEVDDAFGRAAENIQREFGDTFTDIYRNGEFTFEDLAGSIKDIMARLAGEITALLVFRPQVATSGLSGIAGNLGLFGATPASASASAGGTLVAGGGGAGATGLFGAGLGPLGSGLLAAGGGALLGNLAFGGRTVPTIGGGLGGLAGGLGGVLLGSGSGGAFGATLGATFGSALPVIGTALGAAAGAFIADKVFGGSSKSKFGFSSVASGQGNLQTEFGGLSVTRSKNIDSNSLLGLISGIDSSIAQLLSPSQVATVQSGIIGSGDFFSAKGVDNEIFDVAKNRLTAIIDSLAGNQQASNLLDNIARSQDNVEDLVARGQEIVGLINLFNDDGAELNAAEQALKGLNDQFDQLASAAGSLGFSVADVERRRREAVEQLAVDANDSIRQAILAITDPFAASLEALEADQQRRLDEFRALGADLVEAERLFALERQQIVDQQLGALGDFTQSNGSITAFLDSLQTSATGGLTVAERAANADTRFDELLAASRTDPGARADLASFLPGFVDLKRDLFGSTPNFFEFTSSIESTLRNLVNTDTTVTTLNSIGSAVSDGNNAIIETLREELGALREENAALRGDFNLLLNSPNVVAR